MQLYCDTIYISLGHDCSVAYRLQQLKLRKVSLPFDWIRCNELKYITYCIGNKFQIIHEDWSDTQGTSKCTIKNTDYNFVFPHDDIDDFIPKYKRRIERFYDILKNDKIKKIFIRLSKKDETKELLELTQLLNIYTKNYDIFTHVYDKHKKYETWKKDEIDWSFIHETI